MHTMNLPLLLLFVNPEAGKELPFSVQPVTIHRSAGLPLPKNAASGNTVHLFLLTGEQMAPGMNTG